MQVLPGSASLPGWFERGAADRLRTLLTPHVGTLWQALDAEVAALSELHPVTMLISDERQLELLPELPWIMGSDPTSLREPWVSRAVNRAGADVVFSPMQMMGSAGRRYRLSWNGETGESAVVGGLRRLERDRTAREHRGGVGLGHALAPPFDPVGVHRDEHEGPIVAAAEARFEEADERQTQQAQLDPLDHEPRVRHLGQHGRHGVDEAVEPFHGSHFAEEQNCRRRRIDADYRQGYTRARQHMPDAVRDAATIIAWFDELP